MTLLRRRRDMTRDAFSAHWVGPHAEIARRYPGLLRYVQNHVVRRLDPATVDDFECDGMAELWFADDAAMRAALDSPVAQELIVDEPRFLTGVTGMILGDAPAGPPLGGMKVIVLGRAVPGARIEVGSVQGMLNGSMARVQATYRRDALWVVPNPPDTILVAHFATPSLAHAAIDSGVWPQAGTLDTWHAYQVDEFRVV
ncbi:MAG: EthD family reductase [Acetobacteraceae bacterium]